MTEPYSSSSEHLHDHLRRVEQLVRAQVERWRSAVAEQRPDVRWGTGILDPAELSRYLAHPFEEPMDDLARSPGEAHAAVLQATALAARIEMRRLKEPVPDLRVERLRDAFDLARTDLDVLLICLLGELDARYRRLYAYLADEEWRRAPSVGLLAEILRPGAAGLAEFRERFTPSSPLLRHRLISLGEEGGLSARSVVIDTRIAAFLGGSDYRDGWLADGARVAATLDASSLALTAARRAILESLTEACRKNPVVAMLGAEGSGRKAFARAVTTTLDMPLLIADARPDGAQDVYREALLRGAAVYWQDCSSLAGRSAADDRTWSDLLERAAAHPKPSFVDHAQPWDASLLRVPFPSRSLDERRMIWEKLLDDQALADRLAGTFLLTPGHMHEAIRMAGPDPTPDALHEACRRQSSRRLLSIARPVEAPADMTLDDIVLPADRKAELFALRDRIRNRPHVERLLGHSGAKGLVAMFAGSSGTGKTLAAGLIAKDLGRDLLKVDLSQVVSKWVGETEKNLDRVFTEAQDAHAILFFDEAESIFGKRGNVTDARDRYAMQEISFLLQRIEEYEGVVILATNLRQNVDEAFARRIAAIVDFPRPDEECRRRMWRLALTGVAHDLTDADVETLAVSHRLSAAAIAEVVVAGAFVALSRDPQAASVTVGDVEDGVRAELRRLGLPQTS
ncbi:ATP-binding protein [Actinoplanes sp. NPDC023936]|uniref:ATP-binding protein n=1 Tax=Actinoplanes sp. NPDC023936 TaxID=3154910 RepID=UPI0033DD19D5